MQLITPKTFEVYNKSVKVNHGFNIYGKIFTSEDGKSVIYDLKNQITQVAMKYDYINNVFPLYSICLKTTENLMNIIRDNDIQLYLSITYYDISDTNDILLDQDNVSIRGSVFDGMIRIYDKPYKTTVTITENENEGDDTESDALASCEFEISGIPEDIISINEETLNTIYTKCQLFDAAVNLITSVYTGNMYIQDSNRSDIIESILVPPLSLSSAINFIDTQYLGIYDYQTNLFFDEDGMYLYDIFENAKNEIITNYLNLEILDDNQIGSSTDAWAPEVDNIGNTTIKRKVLPSFVNQSKITTHTLGSNSVFYYYDDNFNLITKQRSNSDAYKKVRYLWEPMRRKSAEILDKDNIMMDSITNINPLYITPITKLVLKSDSHENVSGNYSIINKSVIYTTSDMEHFTNQIVFQAIKK